MADQTDGPQGWTAVLGEEFAELATALGNGTGTPPDPDRVVRFVAKAVPDSEACSVTFLPTGPGWQRLLPRTTCAADPRNRKP